MCFVTSSAGWCTSSAGSLTDSGVRLLCLDAIVACRGSLTERKAHIYTNASSVSTERQLMPAVRPSNFWLARVLQAASCDSGQSSKSAIGKHHARQRRARVAKLYCVYDPLGSLARFACAGHKRESIELKLGKGLAHTASVRPSTVQASSRVYPASVHSKTNGRERRAVVERRTASVKPWATRKRRRTRQKN